MASEDPTSDIMFVIRLVISFVVIVIIMFLFFSFRVSIKNDDMQRFDMELMDKLVGSDIASQHGILSAEKLFQTPQLPRACEYEYTMEIESLGARKACGSNSDCIGFCKEILNEEDPEYDCNFELFGQDFCECNGHDGYYWKFGSESIEPYGYSKDTFPTGLETMSGAVLPASVTITSYDSFLSRISCIAQKSYETRSNVSINVDLAKIPMRQGGGDTHFGRKYDNVCVYTDGFDNDNCKYMPDVPVQDFNLDEAFGIIAKTSHGVITGSGSSKGVITAYPLKTDANCAQAENDNSVLAGSDDNVQTIILCAK